MWYFKVNEFLKDLSEIYNIPLIKVVGIMSALSPNNTFASNCKSLNNFLRTNGNCKVNTFNTQKEKALKILKASDNITEYEIKEILGGNALKTKAFFENLYRPENSSAVTIDLWMIRYAKNKGIIPKKGVLTKKRYKIIEEHIKKQASEMNILPHMLQQKIWIDIRQKSY